MTLEISVIICAYTEARWHELETAVKSVQHQTLPPQEIIVVIDHNPRLLRRVQEKLTGVIAIENFKAKGASGSRNSGGLIARAAVLAFLDDDAIAQPDWIEQLVNCYSNPQIIGVGGRIEPLWKTRKPAWFPTEFNWVVGCSYRGMPEAAMPVVVRNVIGANMSVRRRVLIASGGFHEFFGNNKATHGTPTRMRWLHHHAGDEETEFCMRVAQQMPGGQWLYTTRAVVQHQVPEQRTRWNFFLWRCYDEGLGKAGLVKLHDSQTGLSSERSYTFKVLPLGVARGLTDALLHRKLAGLGQAGAILFGLAMTVAGYLVGCIMQPPAAERGRNDLTSVLHHSLAEIPPSIEVR
jgi:glycosyltransferase involved in cell wall biosynthesis